ncbi:MAG: hypothetical protein EZS28_053205 [Streblomastix strix]|uniref:Uncharacterized protein n=1 Tax=Streblomastix strix TaxID=222440 RepID=A0A5J4RHL3_9EUKA|nr:MAG: hypothetical protein EZS28_053205 [Streblomastix strix]
MVLTKTQLYSILKVFSIDISGTVKQFKPRVTQLLNELGFPRRVDRTNFSKVISFVVEKQNDQLQDQVIHEDQFKAYEQTIIATNFKETELKISRLQHLARDR